MVHYFFGEVASHKGEGGALRGFEVYDSVSAVLRFQSGVVGTINATVDVYEKNFATEFTLIAENGTIRLSGTNLNRIDFWNVRGVEKPDLDFALDHQYGQGHNALYRYLLEEKWEMFPSKADVLSGIRLMEMLSF
jgi:UDP-N-acetyl-2-amino-2-deoxyglucuronate dehydrogenase